MNCNWKGKTIIIAEDDQLNFILLQKMIESTSVEILWAKNGKEIISFIETRENIDLILTDLYMPEMNGQETAEFLRNNNYDIPIIVQSATSDYDEIDKLMETGCKGFIKKPIDKTELLETIESLIK